MPSENTEIPRLYTEQRIADTLGVSRARVAYIIRSRKHIKPAAIAGQTYCYYSNAVAQVRHELNAIDARKSDR